MKQKKKIEHSKLLTFIAAFLWYAVNIFAMVMIWRTCDNSALAYVIPSADAVILIAYRWYFKKAGIENQIKLRQKYGDLAREVEKENPAEKCGWGD